MEKPISQSEARVKNHSNGESGGLPHVSLAYMKRLLSHDLSADERRVGYQLINRNAECRALLIQLIAEEHANLEA
jgi:hypothetical protein